MNIQELRTFLAIVDTGNLVRASEVLNVTQSTVTARLKSLEAEVGQTLLVRQKSGATLTAAGYKLHRYADTITNLWQQARQEAGLPKGMSGVCNFACDLDLWPSLGQRFFENLVDTQPDLGLSVWLGRQDDVTKWLDEGKSDLAFTYRSAASSRFGQTQLDSEELILVSTDPSSPVRFDPNYVFVDHGDAFGRDHAIAYADAATARISFGNATTALAHILRAGGSAYLPLRLAKDAIKKKSLFRLPDAPVFRRSVFVTYNKAAKEEWDWLENNLQLYL